MKNSFAFNFFLLNSKNFLGSEQHENILAITQCSFFKCLKRKFEKSSIGSKFTICLYVVQTCIFRLFIKSISVYWQCEKKNRKTYPSSLGVMIELRNTSGKRWKFRAISVYLFPSESVILNIAHCTHVHNCNWNNQRNIFFFAAPKLTKISEKIEWERDFSVSSCEVL